MRILKTATYYYRKTTFILYKFKQIKTQRTKKSYSLLNITLEKEKSF